LRLELDKAVVAKQRAEVKPAPVAVAETKPEPAVAGAPRVRDIVYRGRNGSGDLEIAVAPNVAVSEGRVTKTRAELYLDGVELGANLERKLDVTNFGSPVRSVTTYRDPRIANRVVVVIEFITASTPRIVRHAGGIRWRFQENDLG
jgi:type IV pilus assembly protein PilQ